MPEVMNKIIIYQLKVNSMFNSETYTTFTLTRFGLTQLERLIVNVNQSNFNYVPGHVYTFVSTENRPSTLCTHYSYSTALLVCFSIVN